MTVKWIIRTLKTYHSTQNGLQTGAATKDVSDCITHTDNGGTNFSYHYQTANLKEYDMELLYYYMMRILFKGIAEPDMTIGEIIEGQGITH